MLHRLTGLFLSFTLIQPLLGGGPHACASHEAMSHAMNVPHAAMSMTGMGDMAGMDALNGSAACDDCAPAAEKQPPPPCDHANMSGECATMPSCAAPVAEVEQSSLPGIVTAAAFMFSVAQAPRSLTTPPEPPPPRA